MTGSDAEIFEANRDLIEDVASDLYDFGTPRGRTVRRQHDSDLSSSSTPSWDRYQLQPVRFRPQLLA